MAIMLIGLAILFGAVFGWNALKNHFIAQAMAKMKNPAQTVATMVAKKSVWKPTLSAVGSLRAVQGVGVTTQVGGQVTKIDFHSGDKVKAGELLVQLDVSADRAQLDSLKAQAKLAQINYQRDKKLIGQRGVSQSQLDEARSQYRSAKAQVSQQQATIAHKTIRAPFAGRLGVRQVDLGQYVSAGDEIVTLQSLAPIYMEFSLPQQDIDKVHHGQPVTITVDAYPGIKFSGKVNAIEPKVNTQTRNFNLQALLPNKDKRLRPGMFASVSVELPKHPQYVTLPQAAISYNTYGDYVYIVKHSGKKNEQGHPLLKVEQHVVKTGLTRGDQVAVLDGVKPGQVVVTAGQLKLKNGSPVKINNTVEPANNPSPTLPNS
jgi:membrane fusion protein (multidrug efflux system)